MTEVKYAAIVEKVIHIEGDERSRQCPGHGYPAHSEKFSQFIQFSSEEEMKNWVRREENRKYGKPKYQIIKYEDVKIEVKIEVNFQ